MMQFAVPGEYAYFAQWLNTKQWNHDPLDVATQSRAGWGSFILTTI